MKVKVARQSGMPVQLEKIEEFREEFRKEYDKLYDEYQKDMPKLNEELSKLDERMNEKYDTIVEWDLPVNESEWKKLEADYGGILVTTHKDTKEIMFIILDQGL